MKYAPGGALPVMHSPPSILVSDEARVWEMMEGIKSDESAANSCSAGLMNI